MLQWASSACLIVMSPENYTLLFSSIVMVSINSYLGECTMLSLSASYDHEEMKFWSIGTGLASFFGTGSFLLNLWIEPKVVFLINFFLYFMGYGAGLYLLEIKKNTEQRDNAPDQQITENSTENRDVVLEVTDAEHVLDVATERRIPEQLKFFLDVLFLCLGYFFGYLIGFLFVPVLSPKNIDYQITQFVTRTAQFLGRTLGNYVTHIIRPLFPKTWMFNILHIYTLILLIIYSVAITMGECCVPRWIVDFSFVLSYFVIGISYPIVYNNIYIKYKDKKDLYLGSVGKYTSLFAILGCAFGYPLHLVWGK
jgi:hypothetical protein